MSLSRLARVTLSALLPLLTACADAAGTCPIGDLAGEATATVDGAPWSGPSAQWSFAGSSIQLMTAAGDGWRLSIVAQSTEDGQPLNTALDALPVTISLGDGADGGWALLYPESGGSSYKTSPDAPGTLSINSVNGDGDTLSACFSFTATGDDGSVTLSDGAIVATAMR
jgi:hypothetical protein